MDRIELDLKRPFELNELLWRDGYGKGNKSLVYITARTAQNRLDKVFGPEGWQVSYDYKGDRMLCTVSCLVKGNWVSKTDGAGDTSIEGEKGGISDAFKRACVAWGIGRYLYYPTAFDQNKQPAHWATPEGYDKIMAVKYKDELKDWVEEYNRKAA